MLRRLAVATAAGATLLLTGCSPTQVGEATPTPAPTVAPTSSPTPTEPAEPSRPTASGEPEYSNWPLGEIVLPLRPDGLGEISATPRPLRERRYPTEDVLTPPSDGLFASSIGPVTPEIRERMGETYAEGCPVDLADLSYVQVAFRGFDDAAHTGELVVASSEAEGIVSVFRSLFRADFPIEEMRLPTTADLDALPTGDGNNTAAFVCRPTTGQTSGFSAHAYGLALDLNPFMNPYLKDDVVIPERASSYLDRDDVRPGMVEPDDLVVREFARIGWSWGGDFTTLKDYQHFSALDR
ncbi:M15 family metallopeptidase [Nocardioides sp.]|uniref:M15 family metallopeptidase n=1 Tax=Nocardioides sp. TaxID=35761 RepID=UPI000C9648B8|nr:hypothetical protein [Pimelobacter sp.]